MSVFLHATIEARPAEMGRLLSVLAQMKRILAEAGWGMVGCFTFRTGRLNTIVDLWELEDMNHYDRGIRAIAAHPSFGEIREVLSAAIISETLAFADRVDLDALR